MENKLTTKEDFIVLKKDFNSLRDDIKKSENKINNKINLVKAELTVRMGAMFASSIAILTAIIKLT